MGEEIKDVGDVEKEKWEPSLELAEGNELDNVVDATNDLAKKIEGDEKVTGDDVLKLREALGKMKVNVYGDELTVDEVREMPDFKRDIEDWKEIMKMPEPQHRGGINFYRRTGRLTYLPEDVAQRFLDFDKLEKPHKLTDLNLKKVKRISTKTASLLAKFHFSISLGIEELNTDVARELAKHEGHLFLNGLKNIDKETAEILCHKEKLVLSGLTNMSLEVAEILSDVPATEIDKKEAFFGINSKVFTSLELIRVLMRRPGYIVINGYFVVTADVAKELISHNGSLRIDYLEDISDEAIEILSKKDDLLVFDASVDSLKRIEGKIKTL